MENYKVYLVRLFNNNESFVKIGFTKDSIEKRMYPIFDYSFEEIGVIDSLTYVQAVFMERSLHSRLTMHRYEPLIKFGGCGECFINHPQWVSEVFKKSDFSLVDYVNGLDTHENIVDASDIKVDFYSGRERKLVSLHKEHDFDIFEHINGKKFSTYVKKLIRKDMKK